MTDTTTPPPRTADQLDAIWRRANAATPGPWGVEGGNAECPPLFLTSYSEHLNLNVDDLAFADAEFIAAARTDVPALLAESERLRERVTDLERRPDRAAMLNEAADRLRELRDRHRAAGLRPEAKGLTDGIGLLRALADATPCDCNFDGTGEPCDRHEREQAHADGEHELCGDACEPIALVWRAQDVEFGDDDGAELMLTTSTGQHAILRLDPDQRRALADDLTTHYAGIGAIPAWEAMYEPGNVSDYLIGYANNQAAARGAAEAWLRSETDDIGRLEWVPQPLLAVGSYDQWHSLIQHHPQLGKCDTGINVRHRVTDGTGPALDSDDTEPIRYTADIVLLSEGQVLLIERGWPPFKGRWALPGGHVDPGETSLAAAVRELAEETGIHLEADALSLVGVYDDPERDPRGRYITTAYTATLPQPIKPKAGDDATSARWWPIDALPLPLGFDHADIVTHALDIAADDGAYRERAHLLAWLAAHASTEAVMAPAADVDGPGWHLLYLYAGGRQLSWHIHPFDADLFDHVPHVDADHPRATWDGHTTGEKYAHIRRHTRSLANNPTPDTPKENR